MSASQTLDKLSYAQRQRLLFIESVAYWEGEVGRPRVASVFNISENHITRDFTLYKKAFPNNLSYDLSARVYKPEKKFRPGLGTGAPEEYLSLLRTYLETNNAAFMPTYAQSINAIAMPVPQGTLNPTIIKELTRAICQRQGLKIEYQSMSKPEPTKRVIWPHALIFSGYRWHARGYDNKRNIFTDFVLHRIKSAGITDDKSVATASDDKAFTRIIKIDICPRESLSNLQKEAIAHEYGMKKKNGIWIWSIKMQECLVTYFLYWLRLDKKNSHSHITLRDESLRDKYKFTE